MKSFKAQALLFMSLLMFTGIFSSLVHADSSIYWTELRGRSISTSNVDGTLPEFLNLSASYNHPWFLAIQRAEPATATTPAKPGKVYFTDIGSPLDPADQTIKSMNLDGTNVQVLFHYMNGLTRQPADIALDGEGRIWWTDMHWLSAGIHSAKIDGTDHRWEVDIYALRPPNYGQGLGQTLEYAGSWGLALDMVNRHVYWTDYTSRDIHRADLDEPYPGAGISGTAVKVASGFPGLRGIAVDPGDPGVPGSTRLYITTSWAGDVESVNPADGSITTLINNGFGTDLKRPMDIAVDPVFQKIYFTDHNDGKVYSADTDGFNVITLHDLTYQQTDKKGRIKTKALETFGIALSLDPLATPPAPGTGGTAPGGAPAPLPPVISISKPALNAVAYRADKEELRIDASMPLTTAAVSYFVEVRDTNTGALLFKTGNFASGSPVSVKADIALSSTNMEASAIASNGTSSSVILVEIR